MRKSAESSSVDSPPRAVDWWPTLLYAVILVSPIWKAADWPFFGVDIALVGVALAGIAAGILVWREGLDLGMLWPLLLFALTVIPSIVPFPTSAYGANKAFEFFLAVVPLGIFTAILARSQARVEALLRLVLLAATLAAATSFLAVGLWSEERLALGADTLLLGYYSAAGAIVVMAQLLRREWSYWICLPLLGFLLLALLSTGSRGPLLGLSIGGMAMLVWSLHSARSLFNAVSVLVVASGTVLLSFQIVPETSASRIGRLFADDKGSSVGARQYAIDLARDGAQLDPLFGAGMGSFAETANYFLRYPHNILLELWFEGGLVALLGFLVLFSVAIARLWAARRVSVATPATGLLLLFLIARLISSDLRGRDLLIWLGVALAASAWTSVGDRRPPIAAPGERHVR